MTTLAPTKPSDKSIAFGEGGYTMLPEPITPEDKAEMEKALAAFQAKRAVRQEKKNNGK